MGTCVAHLQGPSTPHYALMVFAAGKYCHGGQENCKFFFWTVRTWFAGNLLNTGFTSGYVRNYQHCLANYHRLMVSLQHAPHLWMLRFIVCVYAGAAACTHIHTLQVYSTVYDGMVYAHVFILTLLFRTCRVVCALCACVCQCALCACVCKCTLCVCASVQVYTVCVRTCVSVHFVSGAVVQRLAPLRTR